MGGNKKQKGFMLFNVNQYKLLSKDSIDVVKLSMKSNFETSLTARCLAVQVSWEFHLHENPAAGEGYEKG